MRYTIKKFKEEYPNDDVCLEAIFQSSYGDLKVCSKCGVINPKFYRVKKRKCYACKDCGYQIHPLANTIFHKSETPLTSWLFAIYLFSQSKNGVSAKELERHLGVTYKTAHRMGHQIRLLMAQNNYKLGGEVEVDETYYGGDSKNRLHEKRTISDKQVIFGMIERDGKAKAHHVMSSGARVLLPKLFEGVQRGSKVYSDDYRAYKPLQRMGYSHTSVNHSKLEFVKSGVHTNTIEGFWSQMKRSLDGTHHCVSPKYLQQYVNEFVYRYNHRDVPVFPLMIEAAAKRV
ncbi:MAG TPA: IS1595 family transposase [Candidatus Saccharimonadales bacterium]|nr:IS1595 family transposase [Candidatus Saccharimonadales bacterium]